MHKASIIGVSGQAGSGKDTVSDRLIEVHSFVRVALADPIKRFGYHVFHFTSSQLWGPSQLRNAVDPKYFDHSPEWERAMVRLEGYADMFVSDVLNISVRQAENHAAKRALVRWFFWLKEAHPSLSPRIMLQTLGTEWGRNEVDQNIWIDYLLRTAKTLLHEDGNVKRWSYDPLYGPVTADDEHIRGVVISDVRFENEFQAIRREGGSVIRILRPDTDASSLSELYETIDTFMALFSLTHH